MLFIIQPVHEPIQFGASVYTWKIAKLQTAPKHQEPADTW